MTIKREKKGSRRRGKAVLIPADDREVAPSTGRRIRSDKGSRRAARGVLGIVPIGIGHRPPCVVLGIDPGAASGAAIMVDHALHSTYAPEPGGEMAIVRLAADLAVERNVPLVIAAEAWTSGGPYATTRTMIGLGAAWGRWDYCLRNEPRFIRRKQLLVRVYPQQWKSAAGIGVRTGRVACLAAMRLISGLDRSRTDDECAAVLIAMYAQSRAEVWEEIELCQRHLKRQALKAERERMRPIWAARRAARLSGQSTDDDSATSTSPTAPKPRS